MLQSKLFLLWDEVALFAVQKLSNIGPGIEKKKIIDDYLVIVPSEKNDGN